ncbi:hypothetical protein P3T73_16640 [Kiritimatiellota bacterium B12222]|nr:hypothetical protein P3T73_16640 [Kiritimatiellota bacterium B12222]
MDLFLIDGISPFFKGYREGKRINWSKIPFEHLEKDGRADCERLDQITVDFEIFCDRAAEMGYTGITLDDMAHMVPHEDYEAEINDKIQVYVSYYRKWIACARARGFKVFITTDFLFTTPASEKKMGWSYGAKVKWFRRLLRSFFDSFPDVSGLILRIGEVDGKDVTGDFRSHLLLRTCPQARKFLREILPEFENAGRFLIFRLWSVGAYPVGDLIWNRKTLKSIFDPFDSPNLILSIKHGESDFFRHLPLNKQFTRSHHKKIVELQARREYEGCGEFPSYIGNDVEDIRGYLQGIQGLVGMSVWCQTGGWTRFGRLTFMENSSVWNEINTWVCIRIFKYGDSAPEALRLFAARFLNPEQGEALIELMNASDLAVKRLLYIDDYALRKLYFRRVRLPSTLSVYWDRILILHPIRKVLKCLVDSGEEKVEQGNDALKIVEVMRSIAHKNELPADGLEMMYRSFEILAEARKYYFLPFNDETVAVLQQLIVAYKEAFPVRYSVRMELTPFTVDSKSLRLFLRTLLREKRGYRVIDHLFTIRFLSILFPVLRKLGKGVIPDFMHKQAMGIEAVFK